VRTPEAEAPELERANAAWARVLETYVDAQGRVDFLRLAEDREDLDRFVAYIARVDPDADPGSFPTPDARLAHRINAYNALSMYGVLELGNPTTNAGLRKIRFFFLRRYAIEQRKESLYTFEKRIRDTGEERVHFALNCMSVSCPRLPREPFRGAELQAQLDRLAREFFASPSNLQVDADARTLRVSSILKFYRDEFERSAGGLIPYVNRYSDAAIPADYRVAFLPYDWTINRTPPRASERTER